MRSITTIAAAVSALLMLAPSVTAVSSDKTVHYKFEKRSLGNSQTNGPRQLLKKRQTVNVGIDNLQLLYLINTTVGTPPQPISMQLDTGSSDIWFPAANSKTCAGSDYYCSGGAYNPDESSTYADPDYPAFKIAYVDGSEVDGTYFTDVLNLGDTQVTNLTMAYATQFDRDLGIMGIGFRIGESSNYGSQPFTYPNIINQLKNQGKIDSLSYSLWLDDLQANTGSILFGGVDTTKYKGNLVSLPIQKDAQSNSYSSFTVALTGLTITGSGNNVNLSPSQAQPAILDSGTTLLYLPDDMTQQIYDGLGVVSYQQGQLNAVPCSYGTQDLTFTFAFGGDNGAKVNVSLAELVLPLENEDGSKVTNRAGVEICQFGIAAAGNDPILFGDTFLRSAYVVYDLDNLQIGLAQTNFDSTSGTGNVQVISSGSGIPDVTRTATGYDVEQTFTGRPLRTADNQAAGSASITATGSPSFKLTPAASTSAGGGQNAAGRPSIDRSVVAALAVSLAALFFGAMLI